MTLRENTMTSVMTRLDDTMTSIMTRFDDTKETHNDINHDTS